MTEDEKIRIEKFYIEKRKLRQKMNSIITRQISGICYEMDELAQKKKDLERIRDEIAIVIDNADIL